MSIELRIVQWRMASLILECHSSPRRNQPCHYPFPATGCCNVQRCCSKSVSGIYIRSRRNQPCYYLILILARCYMEGCLPKPIPKVEIVALCQQPSNLFVIPNSY